MALVPGCRELIEGIAESCPDDPEESGGVDWNPDALRPVFHGHQEHTTADGAPRNLRIYYPTYEGFTNGPPILKLCVTRWPVVLFLHGEPPDDAPVEGYYRRWSVIAETLARGGYVVAVPGWDTGLGSAESALREATAVLDWVRNDWRDAEWVDQRAESTAVAGHSYGALRATMVAAAQPQFGGLVSLGGPFFQPGSEEALDALTRVSMPSLVAWATHGAFEDPRGTWDEVAQPRYLLGYEGMHFDYLPDRDDIRVPRGPCAPLIGRATADLMALFLARQVPVFAPTGEIPVDLDPPEVALTDQQRFFSGNNLVGLDRLRDRSDCEVDLSWSVDGERGTRRLTG